VPITAEELFLGRTEQIAQDRKETSDAEVPWVVRGTDALDEALAYVAVRDASPEVIRGMLRKSINLTERVNDLTLKYAVRYAAPSKSDEEKKKDGQEAAIFSFDTGGGTAHVTQSFSTIDKSPATAADLKKAIGWDGEHVQGVDISVPVFNFGAEVTLSEEQVTPAYIAKLFKLTSKVNSVQFTLEKGPTFDAGEVLFLGATGSLGEPDEDGLRFWKLTFRFSAFPNEPARVIGNLAPVKKDGWDYVWIQYGPELVAAGAGPPQPFEVPVAAYVERVYERADFAGLGLK